jgi:diguanylate cyclase (GGDEF)-like protein
MSHAIAIAAVENRLKSLWTHRDAPVALAALLAYGAAVYLAMGLTRNADSVAGIWPANAFLVAGLLLCTTAAARKALVAACVVANAAAGLALGDPWASIVAFPLIGAVESVVAFRVLRATFGRRMALTNGSKVSIFAFICFAVPAVPSLAGAAVAVQAFGGTFDRAFATWFLADSLGLLVITPAILLLKQKPRPFETEPSADALARHFLLLFGVSLIVFFQSSAPLLFVVVPVSVLIAFRLGQRYAAMATLWLTAVSLFSTYQGWGPASLMVDFGARICVVQLFCFVNLLTSLAVAAELSEREALRSELERVSMLASDRRRQLDTALDAMSQGVCLFDGNSRVVVRNSEFLSIYGLDDDAIPAGTSLHDLMDVCASAGAVPDHNGPPVDLTRNIDIEQQLQDGRYVHINQRVLSDGGVICTYTDVTAARRAEAELLHRTLHDILTGLPNRRLLVDRIDRAMAAAKRGRRTAVMLLDVDYFKSINDNMGHAAGDEVLKSVAARLSDCIRETDTVARLGGDEFALLLSDGDSDAITVASRIIEVMQSPVDVEGKPVTIGVSIGIAHPPRDGNTTDEILKAADIALYKAKRNGRGKFALFDAAEDASVCSARRLESELRGAVEREEFRIVYQPITVGSSGTLAAVEALIRWNHPELGTISPAEFIPLAERNGLIIPIGDWVLEQACRDAKQLPPNVKVSINLSRVQISDRGFVDRVAAILKRTEIPPYRVELEVTETAIIEDEANASRVLGELRDLGVSVAVDDFGVGQSALSCLKNLPIGRIKIDRSLVSDLAQDGKARAIFVAVVSLAKSLGIKTTAEGIESEEQRIIAALAGCDHLQGYFLGRPQNLELLGVEPSEKSKAVAEAAAS